MTFADGYKFGEFVNTNEVRKKSLKVIKKRKCTKGKKKKKPRGLTDVMHMIVVNKELI